MPKELYILKEVTFDNICEMEGGNNMNRLQSY